ncbi:C-terminal binding protein [Yanshouia hominis]|uniref:C-terminal binding protein n=1 Tax=Yanshouia hominis TaxID=2763673 RepID=A0ABR7NER1_9FIRM|nr:C-terminal binding protein [Yanshouia hominis]MBC8574891.1 C-terminal binding protein [Yanshouia hominis]
MSNFKVYVSDYDYPDISIEKEVLEPIGAQVIGLQDKTGENLAELAADADGILQQYAKIFRPTIEKLKNCKIIARYGIGVDIVDVAAAYEHGMVVTNVPDYCIDEVADHAAAYSMMLSRNLPFYNAKVHAGSYRWEDWRSPITRSRNARYGLLGFGRIAQNLSRKMAAFGFELVSYDPYVSESFMRTYGVKKVGVEELFSTSHIVCVLTPYTAETAHIVNEERLQLMQKDSYLVAVSRGKCVDNKALYKALSEGWITAAALDDPEEEPMKMKGWTPDINPLFSLDNCFFTPHTAYISKEALTECRYIAAENVKSVLLGKRPMNLVRPAAKM